MLMTVYFWSYSLFLYQNTKVCIVSHVVAGICCFIPCPLKGFCSFWSYSVWVLFCHHPLFFQPSHLALSLLFNPSGFKSSLPSTVCAVYVSSEFLSCLKLDLFRPECLLLSSEGASMAGSSFNWLLHRTEINMTNDSIGTK